MTRHNLVAIAFLSVASLTACEQQDKPEASLATQKSTFDIVRDDVPKWMEFAAAEQLESASLEQELQRSISDLQNVGLQNVSVMRTLYASRRHRPAWVDLTSSSPSGLNPHGAVLSEALSKASASHGLDPAEMHTATIAALVGGTSKTSERSFTPVRFEAAELTLVGTWAEEHPDATPEQLARALARRDGPAPRLATMIAERAASLGGDSRTRVRLDLHLTDALIEYGMRMRWSNRAWTRDVDWPDHLDNPAADTRLGWDDLRRERRDLIARRELAPVFSAPESLTKVLGTFVPPFEQYGRLAESFEEYAKIVAGGGWSKLPDGAGELRSGDDKPAVAQLKKRLAAENYWKGDETSKFTESLAEALREYQRAHQLWEKGSLSRETRASLDVPADRRLAQIRIALQRWRESKIGDADHYLFVNIPDFRVEVWRAGQRKLRIRTVVGATTHERDAESGAFEYVHATPSVSSQVEHVVLNPYWWVPADIVKNEIEPEIAKNPWYLAQNNYEWAEDDRGEAALRQRPGPGNALGRVKINFPNDFAIYMHDTPDKSLFKFPARAFSHGCIRLQQPMELAKYLLEQSEQWDEAVVTAQLDTGEEKWLKLDKPLPVHVEYYVVRVDDLGRTNFLSDLYRRDSRRMTGAMALGRRDTESAAVSTVD